MCGVVGYTGGREACGLLIDGLKRLEYRGYDSAGVAVMADGRIDIRKSAGKLKALEAALMASGLCGTVGIGHTRWATHGRPSDENAHPHTDCSGGITVVHNGIIENYQSLKTELISQGHKFDSETDTEVIAHLVEGFYQGSLAEAVRLSVRRLEGSVGLLVMDGREPHTLVAARRHSPLVLGLGDGERFVASDVSAFLDQTRQFIYLEDNDVAVVNPDSVTVMDIDGRAVAREAVTIAWDASMAERGGYEHFMLKEIHEQPRAIRETMRGRINPDSDSVVLEGLGLTPADLQGINRVVMIACGTAYHASMVGKNAIESLCRLPVELDWASELRYRDPVIDENTLGIVVSQSGETLDTIVGMREAKAKGAKVVAITNVVGSLAAREADGVLYTYAGPEIAVASTKAYTTQIMALYLLAIHIAQARRTMAVEDYRTLRDELWELPLKAEAILNECTEIERIAARYYCFKGFLYTARGVNLASALEGALKAKEISYVHAEGYAAGEMKHGPIAMIDPTFATVAVAVRSKTYDKILGNIREIKAREGEVIAIATEGDETIQDYADRAIAIPETLELLSPILVAIPMQLFAYNVAINRAPSIDQPRNLAKTVTVE